MTVQLAVVETDNANPDNKRSDEWIELAGYVVVEPQQDTRHFVIEATPEEQAAYDEHVGQRRVVSVWADGKVLRYVALLEKEGFEIPYSLTHEL